MIVNPLFAFWFVALFAAHRGFCRMVWLMDTPNRLLFESCTNAWHPSKIPKEAE